MRAVLTRAPAAASSRGLTTARSVLRVLSLLAERPAGIRADEVAEQIGKSTSTAYYLLSSLCEEGFAVHCARGLYRPVAAVDPAPVAPAVDAAAEAFGGAVQELFTLTRRRSYLGIARAGRIEIVAAHGRQGVPRMPGLGSEIRDSLHALAMGKVVLAELELDGLSHYLDAGLRSFTPRTITDPGRLVPELERVRARGVAIDRDEFEPGFCCVAAPIRDGRGRFAAALGLSARTRGFEEQVGELVDAVSRVAAEAGGGPVPAPRRGDRVRRAGASKQMQKTAVSCQR